MSLIELDKEKLKARLVDIIAIERDRRVASAGLRAELDAIAVEVGRLRDRNKTVHGEVLRVEGDLPALMQEKAMLVRVLGNGSVLEAEAKAVNIVAG